MNYLEIKITLSQEFTEILMAELAGLEYDSFAETEEGFDAYIEEGKFREEELKELLNRYKDLFSVNYSIRNLENKNWNEEWEKNFSPVIVSDKCLIRASFHKPDPAYPYEIIINPKMSFGTGHHETTSMMIENQLQINHKGKIVMDAGSGTGILSVMASKLGADSVMAFDVEEWAYENMKENIQLNHCHNIQVGFGDIYQVKHPFSKYDIILANINKNVLLKEIQVYSSMLDKDGVLILSGFYTEDENDIMGEANKYLLEIAGKREKNRWASLIFHKK